MFGEGMYNDDEFTKTEVPVRSEYARRRLRSTGQAADSDLSLPC